MNAKLELLQLKKLELMKREMEQATFKPQINQTTYKKRVKPEENLIKQGLQSQERLR